jgi:hypothetical protein
MTGVRSRALPAAALGLALGLAVGAALGARLAPAARAPEAAAPSPAAPAPETAGSDDARVRELEAEVVWWRSAYEEVARSQESGPQAPPDTLEPETAADAAAAAQPPAPAPAFDLPSLETRGYTAEEASRLRARWEAHELELLYLRDRARREGWLRRPRFYGESRRLQEAMRGELGDRDYDAMLYGAGQNNRVVVAGVLGDSAAERAGFQTGDEIISYDGRRIFDAQELLRATSQGRAGQDTELRFRRDGEELRVMLPRGPIGVRLQPTRLPPDGFL